MIFSARQLRRKCSEPICGYLYRPHEKQSTQSVVMGFGKIMVTLGCTPKFIAKVWYFNNCMKVCIKNDGENG